MTGRRMPSDRNGFDIAIFCAVNVEVSALESLFEEDPEEPERSYGKASEDPNTYKIGIISDRAVVLAYPPEKGGNSAAKTAIWLKISFPNISLALLVGICGGVPSNNEGDDILLGDVIISTRLVQYDLGKLYPNVFSTRDGKESNLSEPPSRVKSFLNNLQGRITSKTLQENTNKFFHEMSLPPDIASPEVTADHLYSPLYRHKHQRIGDCLICGNCKSENDPICNDALATSCDELGCSNDALVRRRRVENAKLHKRELHRPMIHFGKMASGNFVMKSGLHRDKIASNEGIIAFEMEGAAVWEEFPTIIIKGVSDYADSHKHNEWQTYAAYMAAACSKAVIKLYKGSNELRIWPQGQPGSQAEGPKDFAIPRTVHDTAIKAKERYEPSFWSHEMYRDDEENAVSVYLSANIDSSERLACMFEKEPTLGFGMQWLVPGKSKIRGEQTIDLSKNNISLIVLAKEDSIGIFHLASHPGSSVEQKIAPKLRSILEAKKPRKVGARIIPEKWKRLKARFGIKMDGIFELADLDKLLNSSKKSPPKADEKKTYVYLGDLVEKHLHLELFKPNYLRLSNWSRPVLHNAQFSYVATDAYATYQLFQVMDEKRRKLRPLPPLPPCVELLNLEQVGSNEDSQTKQSKRQRPPDVTPSSSQSSPTRRALEEDRADPETPLKKRKPDSQQPVQDFTKDDMLDQYNKFVIRDGEAVFNFGRQYNETLRHVAKTDPGYLIWMMNSPDPFPQEVVKIAGDALEGNFPTPPRSQGSK